MWTETVVQHIPRLSKLQATVLALWSFGMVMAKCGDPRQLAGDRPGRAGALCPPALPRDCAAGLASFLAH